MTDYINPHKLYPDDISRRIDNPPGFDSVRVSTGFQWDGGDKTERRCMANQCICCGQEMPEGDQVCTRCRERTAFNRNASQTIDDRIRQLEAEIRMLRVVKKAM